MQYRKPVYVGLFSLAVLALGSSTLSAQQYSKLWGKNGELWNPEDTESGLRDFTNVGYMAGDEPIPFWPVGVDVTDFGAIPDDDIDDSQAFIDAIAACPDYHAVFVPNGRYIIEQRIEPQRDHFVLRGEDMYESVLFMPKYLNEIYISENGWQEDKRTNRDRGVEEGFFRVVGGTERSIENLTFELREQRKMSTFAPKGSTTIDYSGNVSHSWIRNIYIKNADEALRIGRTNNLSIINIVVDNFIQRRSIYQWQLASLFGITAHGAQYNLFHNLEIRNGSSLHGIDLNNAPNHNVFSNLNFSEGTDVSYHGSGGINDLFTDINAKAREMRDEKGMTYQTYWGVRNQEVTDDMYNSVNNHVFVGYGDDRPEKTTPSIWYEPLDPAQLTPVNIYLAQMAYFGKPLPEGPPPPVPSPHTGNVIRIAPTDDNVVASGDPDTVQIPDAEKLPLQELPYLKYDLTGINLSNIASARLRCNFRGFGIRPYRLSVSSVTDDSWSQDTLTYNNRPPVVSLLDSEWIDEDRLNRRVEFDVTAFVQDQITNGDPVISFNIMLSEGNGFMGNFRSREDGLLPELIIERVADPVPGAPTAPTGIGSTSLIGNIILDWDDNPESDVATYNVYRSPTWPEDIGGEGYQEPVAEGLTTSDYVDISTSEGWQVGKMDYRTVYKYMITAVDEHGYESPTSIEFVAATLHPSNSPPAFNATVTLPNATALSTYSESLAGEATDPDSDPLHFMKVSGPNWLVIAQDGSLSGTPNLSDAGLNQFTFQVTAIGGSVQKVIDILVEIPADDPAGAPAAPTGLLVTPKYE